MRRRRRSAGPAAPGADAEALARHADAGSNLHEGLSKVAAADDTFDPDHFLAGAKMAYEMIVTAYADGDRATLKNLLEPEVYEGFVSAIGEREGRGERVESTFVGIESAKISHAGLDGRTTRITVRFVSELISVTKNKDGAVVDGDPTAVQHIRDAWTFARDVRSRDPNWKLVATEAV